MEMSALEQIRNADLHAGSAEVVLDGQTLLIDHVHIHSVEPIAGVHMCSDHGPAIGEIQLGEQRCPVFCLDADLSILAKVPATRRACVLLTSDHGGVGFLCDEIRMIDDASLAKVSVPGCMSGEHNLVDSLAVIDGKVACVLSADRLSLMLRSQTTVDAVQTRAQSAGEH